MSKVSVVIPFWKGIAYLRDCVQSIDNQQLSDYEILLVCDSGADAIPEDIQRHPLIEIERLNGEHPFGPGRCRNVGMRLCQGKYVYFIDSDDYLLEGTLSSMLELAEQKEAYAVAGALVGSWFSLKNYQSDRVVQECDLSGMKPLDEVLEERFRRRISATHLLIERDLLEQNDITFPEQFLHYSDMPFVVRVYQVAKKRAWYQGEAVYVSRYHNDTIHLPALSDTITKESAEAFLCRYRECCSLLSAEDTRWQEILDRQLMTYVLKQFPARIDREKVQDFCKVLREMSDFRKRQKEFSFWEKRKLGAIRKGNDRFGCLADKISTFLKKKQGIIGSRIQIYRVFEHFIFNKMPVRKDWIIFESFFGKSYSDSPKYLYEYMQKIYGKKFRYIWVLNQGSISLKESGKHKVCKRESLRYMYYMSRCGYKIFNVRQPGWYKKRQGAVFLETWHGTPLKKLGFDMRDVYTFNQRLKMVLYEQAKEWNYLVSANRFSTDVFARAFEYNRNQILEYGYPRNDILYAENKDEIAAEVKRELGIPEGKRVILYAPTWRDKQYYESNKNDYQFSLAIDFKRLQEEFGRDSVILLRTHYYVAKVLDLSEYEGFVYSGIDYEDVSRLYLASDICITDYSSVFFDYANLRRPLLFFVYDYEEYADEVRGLYIDMEKELPGPILKTNDELIEALRDIAAVEEKYSERYEDFYNRFCNVDDGHASERIIEKVFGERESK